MTSFEWLKDTLTEDFGIPDDLIKEDAMLIDDLGMDSLDMVELLFAAEDEFGEIDDEGAESVLTVADAIRLIEATSKQGVPA